MFRVTGPPASRSVSGPVASARAALTRCRYGSGFFGANGNDATALDSTVSSMLTTPPKRSLSRVFRGVATPRGVVDHSTCRV